MENVLIQIAVKTTIQKVYDKELFDIYDNTLEVLEDFLFVEKRRPVLEEGKKSIKKIFIIINYKIKQRQI